MKKKTYQIPTASIVMMLPARIMSGSGIPQGNWNKNNPETDPDDDDTYIVN